MHNLMQSLLCCVTIFGGGRSTLAKTRGDRYRCDIGKVFIHNVFFISFFRGKTSTIHFFAVVSFGVVYSLGTIFWRSDTSHVSSNSVSIVSEYLQDLQQGAAKTEPSLTNEPACKLPSLNAEHPKVMQFIKDIGPLVCKGNTFSSFDRDVLA